jgi:tetrapyrrole methylase family protein / MazG family protein
MPFIMGNFTEKSNDKFEGKSAALADVIKTVHQLRAPGGCPWDRKQTHQSLRPYMIEEAYEVLDVLDQVHSTEDLKTPKIAAAFKEELGDVLMQVLLHSEMADEEKAFDFYDVASTLNEKLIRRHPHVFPKGPEDAPANNADSALQNWEKEKAKEKASNPDASVLDGTPKGLPSLQRTGRVIEKVSKVGFQWKDLKGPIEKLDEELGEFKEEVIALEKAPDSEKDQARARLQAELGDLIFSLCNVAYLMKLSPEDAIRGTLGRFEARFRHVEKRLKQTGKTPEQSNLEEMDKYWDEAKKLGL